MRTVTVTLRDSLGRPKRVGVRFSRHGLGVKDGKIYIQDSPPLILDDNGTGSIELLETTDSELPTFYRCRIPGEEPFDFTLEAGAEPIDLSELRMLGVVEGTPAYQTIKDYLDANTDRFKGPPGQTFTYRIRQGNIFTIADGEYVLAPLLEIETDGIVVIESGGILQLL